MKKNILVTVLSILVITSAIIPQKLASQNKFNKDTLLVAAREIMADTHYCGFVTIDSTGQPQTRTLNPFPANDELITWFATSRTSRKVRQIKNNPNVCVYYANHQTAKG
ncbi:MAG TPA: pyridoxamine 5'-phosphate oxidase family protein, partial [Bacteroidota bacterium]|nr:pyridoxamine 5'-phosphate oxidase family protein [Bacteroidota bacterium]